MKRLGSKNCHLESKTETLGMGCDLMAGVAARGEVLEWRLSLEKARLPTLYNRRLQGMSLDGLPKTVLNQQRIDQPR